MFNHWIGSQCLNTGPCHENRRKVGIPANTWKVWSCQSCHDGRALLKPLVVTIFQKLKDNFGRASERVSASDRGKGIRQSNAREKEESLTWSSGQIQFGISKYAEASTALLETKLIFTFEKNYQHMPCSSAKIKFIQSDLSSVLFSLLGHWGIWDDTSAFSFVSHAPEPPTEDQNLQS